MKLNYHSPIGYTGYGQVGGYLLNELVAQDNEVAWFPLGQPQVQEEHNAAARDAYALANTNFDPDAPSLKIWHENLLAERISRKFHAALPFFERNRFDRQRQIHLNCCDLIISPSKWGTEILANNGITTPVATIPMGVDRSIFHEHYVVNRDPEVTRFVNVNKIEVRKGHQELIDAFSLAFEKTDKVELYLLWHNPFLTQEETADWVRLCHESKLAEKIRIVSPMQHNLEVARLISGCDCSVCPTKAEGWGMSLLETLSCGKHLITTDYGAQTEFADENNSLIIKIDDLCPAYDGKWFFGDFEWADFGESQMDQLVEAMRSVHKMALPQKRLNAEGVRTAERFTWSQTARSITQEMSGKTNVSLAIEDQEYQVSK